MFREEDHPRDRDGKFTDKDGSYSDGVNERIKWAKENSIDLPLNLDGSVDDLKLQELYDAGTIPLPDETLPRSLSAKWGNEDITMSDGTTAHFVDGSKLHHKEVFAGKGCKRQIDEVDSLISKYGGSADEWIKVKAFGTVVCEDGKTEEIEVHWYEEPSVGRVKVKEKVR